jgi:Helicase associated domain
MSNERKHRLNKIGFVWDSLEAKWEAGLSALKKFKAREGHCLVHESHIEGTYKLGQWVGVQRMFKDTMSTDRRCMLDKFGFIWDALEARWEERFAALKKFKAREGHCKVPYNHIEDTYTLGPWVGRQRFAKDTMSKKRRQRLNGIGFIWDALEAE